MSDAGNENVSEISCPMGAEKINASARKFRYCGEILDPALRMVMENKNSRIAADYFF